MRRVGLLAWGATFIWIAVIGILAVTKQSEFAAMSPNEWGDFLAGTISPLALIWLVAGYLQQGKELKQNTRALMLQHQELKELVEANNKIANHAEAQAAASNAMVELSELEREEKIYREMDSIQPVFEFEERTCYDRNTVYTVLNTGEEARDVKISSLAFEDCLSDIPYQFRNGEKWTVSFEYLQQDWEFSDFIVDVKYIDITGAARLQKFTIRSGFSYLSSTCALGATGFPKIPDL